MSHQVYKFEPGQCVCLVGDPGAGAHPVNVRKLSGTEAVLDPAFHLEENQYVYATVKLQDGPSLALSGLVVTSAAGGILIQWTHSHPRDADKLDAAVAEYLRERERGSTGDESQQASVWGQSARTPPVPSPSPPPRSPQAPVLPPGPGDVSAAPVLTTAATASSTPTVSAAPAQHVAAAGAAPRSASASARIPKSAVSAKPAEPSRDAEAARDVPPPRTKDSPLPKAKTPRTSAKKAASAEGRAQAGAESKAESRVEPKTEAKSEAKEKGDVEGKPGSRTESKPESRTDGKTDASTDASTDGGLDVDAKLRSKSKTVRASDLASRLDTVQVVNMGAIRTLVKEAVEDALALQGAAFNEADRRRLLEEAEAAFAERLALYKSEKSGLEDQIKTLQDSLGKAQALLEEERGRILSANQFTVSDAGMVELESRLGRMLDWALRTGQVSPQLEEDMRGVVRRLLDDEREKIREQAQQAQSDKVALLEKKVQRLAASLENAESERDLARHRAQALEASGGPLRNIMTAGLDGKDPHRERKLGLLKEIFQINKQIREQLLAEGRLAARTSATSFAADGDADSVKSKTADEEAQIAGDLGIRKIVPGKAFSGPSSGPGAAQTCEPGKVMDTDRIHVPVLASGPSGDPDDLPWAPASEGEASLPKTVKIKKPRRGS